MRYRILIKEKRSRNTNVSILKKLEPYSKDPSYFVTFTNLEKVGINPNNRFATPMGIYVYNLKDLWTDWIAGDMFFGEDRRYVSLLKLNTDKVFHFQNYTNYKKDYEFLKNYYQRNYQQSTGISFEQHIQNIKEKATLYEHNSEAAEIWDIMQTILQINDTKVGTLATRRSTVLWNKLLREMGYEAVVDRGSNIHLLQSSQGVFLTPSSYKVIDTFINSQYGQKYVDDEYWGSDKQPFWRPGPNPTIDIVIFKKDQGELKVLLIKRSATSKAEANQYALPGGFHDTNQPRGEPWKNDRESARQAAFRELAEETNLWIPTLNDSMKLVGTYEGNGRDPRDNKEAWSRTTAFSVVLPENVDSQVTGRDDAQEATWMPVTKATTMKLAFDHNKILQDALNAMQLNETNIFKRWKNYLSLINETTFDFDDTKLLDTKQVNLFILIGPPAVGKSTWEKKYFAGIPEDQILKINRDDIIEKRFLSTGFSNKILFSTPPDSVPTGEIDPDKPEFGKVIQYKFGGKVRRAYENIFKATDKINSVYYKRLKEAHSGYYPYVVFDGLYSTPEDRKKVTDSFSHLKNLKKIAVFFEFQGHEDDIYDRSIKRAQRMEKQFGSVKGRKFDRTIAKDQYDKIFEKMVPPTKEEPANFDVIMNVKYGSDGEYETINEQIFEIDDLELIQILEEAKKKRAYKPNFSREKKQGLHGWFARNKGKGWINCRTGGPCGRSSADKKGGKYPACRPTKAQCKSAGKGPLRKKKSSKPISWTKKKKKED